MDKLNQIGGLIIPFQRTNGINGHVCFTDEAKVYAYLMIPDDIELPFKLDVTTSDTFTITQRGYIYLGFPELETPIMVQPKVSNNVYTSRLQALKQFKH